jgi:ribosome maturation factor RimP
VPTFCFGTSGMDKESLTERIKAIARGAAGSKQIELVHVEIAGTKRDSVVRVYIDKAGGVTLEDCSVISREMEEVLDVEDLIPARYVLEVSSPGIERQLYSIADFEKFTGQLVKVKTKTAIDNQKTFVGMLQGVDGSMVTIDDRSKGVINIDYSDVDKANLKIDLSNEFKGR